MTCTGLVLAKLESSVCKISGVVSVDGHPGSVKFDGTCLRMAYKVCFALAEYTA